MRWAWQWFWYILVRNRFTIAIASLIWLIWRSGTQPRRLAYPCQQAAAANLGVLAVLLVPALARRRRQRRALLTPRTAEWAAGSVALAGILFVLVSAGVSVYSDVSGMSAEADGTPAIHPWPRLGPADFTSQADMSPRVAMPNGNEAVVALNRNDRVTYGALPYGGGADTAYDLVWQTVADLHLGPPANPLEDLVQDVNGDGRINVILKPNWVEYYTPRGGIGDDEGRSPAYTHPAMMRPVVDMVVAATQAMSPPPAVVDIAIGDSSGHADNSQVPNMGYPALVTQLRAIHPGVTIRLINLQNTNRFSWITLDTGADGPSAYAGSGYVSTDLAKAHMGTTGQIYYNATDSQGVAGPGVANCMGAYAVSDELLDADLIVDMPKVKVHFYAVNTLSLKNWVGVTMMSTGNTPEGWLRIAHHNVVSDNYVKTFGNDIMWREVVDVHRGVLYWDRATRDVAATPQRHFLCVLDAIVCGETDLYFHGGPTHYRLNSVLASVDPVALDAVGSRLQRYKYTNIPIPNNANVPSTWPIGTGDPGKLRVVGDTPIGPNYDHLSVFDTWHDGEGNKSLVTWEDWAVTELHDLTPPIVNSATIEEVGGRWHILANATNAHVAYYYYGQGVHGAPNVVRLAKSGDTFTAVVDGAAGNGTLVFQDEWFNTTTAEFINEPAIGLDPDELAGTIHVGENPAPAVVTLSNIGIGTLSYEVTIAPPEAQAWLHVSPTSGDCDAGYPVALDVTFTCDGLMAGTYEAEIHVEGNATNSPQDVPVTVVVETVACDQDFDGDVDLADYGAFQACRTSGSAPGVPAGCAWADFNSDDFVNDVDYYLLMSCLSGANVIAEKTCDD